MPSVSLPTASLLYHLMKRPGARNTILTPCPLRHIMLSSIIAHGPCVELLAYVQPCCLIHQKDRHHCILPSTEHSTTACGASHHPTASSAHRVPHMLCPGWTHQHTPPTHCSRQIVMVSQTHFSHILRLVIVVAGVLHLPVQGRLLEAMRESPSDADHDGGAGDTALLCCQHENVE